MANNLLTLTLSFFWSPFQFNGEKCDACEEKSFGEGVVLNKFHHEAGEFNEMKIKICPSCKEFCPDIETIK